MAFPRQMPLSSFFSPLTLEKPAFSIFDLASPSVKLLRPSTGALTCLSEELMALFCGPFWAGGGLWLPDWASAAVATKAMKTPSTTDLRMRSEERRVGKEGRL